jgi:homoserine dehydrogenase
MGHPLTVLKFGGSVLRDESDLDLGVNEIERWIGAARNGESGRVIAVVSAFGGTTDRLLADARRLSGAGGGGRSLDDADPAALAMLLATGEFTTASMLGLALARRGIAAKVLGPAAVSLRTEGGGSDANPTAIDAAALHKALSAATVAVVPGFIALDPHGHLSLLGRGGSDLTALFLAAELNAERCRLMKDVDGVYDRDPNAKANAGTARRYRSLHWDEALTLDGGIVQHKAVRLARSRGLAFEVGSWGREDFTTVCGEASVLFEQSIRPAPVEAGV